jgi:ABC-type transporter Mla maintaining outer membrane lipid asymmetry permease subunit MlaE
VNGTANHYNTAMNVWMSISKPVTIEMVTKIVTLSTVLVGSAVAQQVNNSLTRAEASSLTNSVHYLL